MLQSRCDSRMNLVASGSKKQRGSNILMTNNTNAGRSNSQIPMGMGGAGGNHLGNAHH